MRAPIPSEDFDGQSTAEFLPAVSGQKWDEPLASYGFAPPLRNTTRAPAEEMRASPEETIDALDVRTFFGRASESAISGSVLSANSAPAAIGLLGIGVFVMAQTFGVSGLGNVLRYAPPESFKLAFTEWPNSLSGNAPQSSSGHGARPHSQKTVDIALASSTSISSHPIKERAPGVNAPDAVDDSTFGAELDALLANEEVLGAARRAFERQGQGETVGAWAKRMAGELANDSEKE